MLNSLASGVWEASQPLRAAGFDLGHRMTVIRDGSGELAVHSPVAFSPEAAAEIQALGPVRHILAPSAMHDLFLADWLKAFPAAGLLHSPALRLKGIDPARAQPLTRGPMGGPGGWQAIPIQGMPKIQEFAILHPASRSLIVCDLVFNLPPGRGLQKLLQKLNGIHGQAGPSRLFKSFIRDRAAFRGSIQEIAALDFDRLIVGHGANFERDARDRFRRAFAWLDVRAERGTSGSEASSTPLHL